MKLKMRGNIPRRVARYSPEKRQQMRDEHAARIEAAIALRRAGPLEVRDIERFPIEVKRALETVTGRSLGQLVDDVLQVMRIEEENRMASRTNAELPDIIVEP